MRILVAIANYGTKNIQYAKKLIQEYQSMPFMVKIYVLSEAPKSYGDGVTVIVGLPSKDPWSLPFGHKKIFSEHIDEYDLFIYTEDDTLIREENVTAFVNATEKIDNNYVAGFMRYELYPDGRRNYPDMHGPYHWVSNSVKKSNSYTVARFSNDHSACYMLTQDQLRRAIASGGYLVAPYQGRYDLICSAGTDPYTQCGFTRVICISHLGDFELHHLSDVYLGRVGLDDDKYKLQIEALSEILNQKRDCEELFKTEKPLATAKWDKIYYEASRHDILRLIPDNAKNVLSVGCGWGATEGVLLEKGCKVAAIPLDSIIGRLAEARGIRVLPPNFERAFEILNGQSFDVVLISDVLQHVSNPIEVLRRVGSLLKKNGIIVGSVPNLNLFRRLGARLVRKKWARVIGNFDMTKLHLTSKARIKVWLRNSGFYPSLVSYSHDFTRQPLLKLLFRNFKVMEAPIILFKGNKLGT
jgi:2-polyprenyl-3-methyl-5-hydroxy-6-metoxy-1,4-benzoquinol methylase